MIYGYVAIDTYIYNNWDTDYQDTAVADVKKVRLFLNEKERDASAEAERLNSHFRLETQKFTTKSNHGNLQIIPYREYYTMVNEINRLNEELSKYKK